MSLATAGPSLSNITQHNDLEDNADYGGQDDSTDNGDDTADDDGGDGGDASDASRTGIEVDEDEDEDEDEEEEEPPYSAQEIVATITSFYHFLTTLHFSPDDLLIPPASGWPPMPEDSPITKSPLVQDVLRHLPYFRRGTPSQIQYKSIINDYSDLTTHGLNELSDDWLFPEEIEAQYDGGVTTEDVLTLAQGHESYGQSLILVPKKGEIMVDHVRAYMAGPVDLVEYFDDLKEQYRTLKLIGAPRKNILDLGNVPEKPDDAGAEESSKQEPFEGWATYADVQRLRKLYRDFGWPENFRRDEAMKEVAQWMDELEAEGKDSWMDDF